MESVDQQFRQLKENYERMTEGELYACAEKAYDLTEIAREALQAVLFEKGISVRLRLEPPARVPAKPLKDDEGLINLGMHGWPADAEAAWLTMGALSVAGIPSFLGPQNVMHLEEFRDKFNGLVSLKVREVDWNRASIALKKAADAGWWDKASWWDNGKEKEEGPDEEKDYVILCPKSPRPGTSSSGAAMPAVINRWMRASCRKFPAASPGREKSFPHVMGTLEEREPK
jgi:hypothetical protein